MKCFFSSWLKSVYRFLELQRHFIIRIDTDIDYTSLQKLGEGNRKTMNRNWSNQKANPALKTKTGNK